MRSGHFTSTLTVNWRTTIQRAVWTTYLAERVSTTVPDLGWLGLLTETLAAPGREAVSSASANRCRHALAWPLPSLVEFWPPVQFLLRTEVKMEVNFPPRRPGGKESPRRCRLGACLSKG